MISRMVRQVSVVPYILGILSTVAIGVYHFCQDEREAGECANAIVLGDKRKQALKRLRCKQRLFETRAENKRILSKGEAIWCLAAIFAGVSVCVVSGAVVPGVITAGSIASCVIGCSTGLLGAVSGNILVKGLYQYRVRQLSSEVDRLVKTG